MNTAAKSLLLCTNDAKQSFAALEYGVWLAGLLRAQATLVGVVEKPGWRKTVEQALEEIEERLIAAGISYETQLLVGNIPKILRQIAIQDKHLVIMGPLGRPGWRRWLQGRSFRRIAMKLDMPLLYVPTLRSSLDHILVCLGGLGYARNAVRWAIYLAQHAQADITFLHIVEPIHYDYPIAREIQGNWERIQETDTPQGNTLSQALEDAQNAGVSATLKVRRGDIVHEILSEIRQGQYDLVAMGFSDVFNSLRHYFMPNVTAEVAELISVPVLTVQPGQELIFDLGTRPVIWSSPQ